MLGLSHLRLLRLEELKGQAQAIYQAGIVLLTRLRAPIVDQAYRTKSWIELQ